MVGCPFVSWQATDVDHRAHCRYTEALKHASFAEVGPEPQTPTAVCYSNRSLANLKLQRYSQALADGQECTKVAPRWAKGFFRVGETLRHMGKYTEAEAFFKQAAALDPADANLLQYLKATSSKAEIQRTPEFLLPFEKSCGLNPQTVWPARGGLVGAVFGVLLIGLDSLQTHPSLTNFLTKGLFMVAIVSFWSAVGLAVVIIRQSMKQEQLMTDSQKKDRQRAQPDEHQAGIFGMGSGARATFEEETGVGPANTSTRGRDAANSGSRRAKGKRAP